MLARLHIKPPCLRGDRRFRGPRVTQFIVVDRVLMLANKKYTDKGDTKCIHAGDVEKYTLAYQQQKVSTALNVTLTPGEEWLSGQLMSYLESIPPLQDPMREFILTAGLVVLPDLRLPKTHRMAMKSKDSRNWRKAEQAELDSMTTHQVFTHMVLPPGKKKIDTKWVYTLKSKDGVITKYKARLVAKGYEQIYGVDYEETYAPVAKFTSLRIVLAISAQLNFDIQQMDVDTAFLNAKLAEEVYIAVPEGITVAEGCDCIRLNRALYGLKQSPREWYEQINAYLQSLSFKRLKSEHCLYFYINNDEICIISLYVDDLIIAGSSKAVTDRIKMLMKKRYSMKDLGDVDEILGCRVHVDSSLGTVTMNQKKYTEGLLEKYLKPGSTWCDTPADNKLVLVPTPSTDTTNNNSNNNNNSVDMSYREVVGSLLWLSLGTRPDITYAVSQVAKFSSNPGPQHWEAVHRIIRYLHGTRTLGLTYHAHQHGSDDSPVTLTSMKPHGYVDADYARDKTTFRSVTGYIYFLAKAPISWQTRQQPSVALSTMEAEFMAACAAAQESVWLIQLLKELSCELKEPIVLFEDNKACIDYSKNSTNHQRTKHISVRYHFIRDLITDKVLHLQAIPTEENIADILTKPLDKRIFQYLRSKFMSIIH